MMLDWIDIFSQLNHVLSLIYQMKTGTNLCSNFLFYSCTLKLGPEMLTFGTNARRGSIPLSLKPSHVGVPQESKYPWFPNHLDLQLSLLQMFISAPLLIRVLKFVV